MAQLTIKGQKALDDLQKQLTQATNNQLEDYFLDIADDAINMSPVWSGAYVKSFSFKADNSSSRGRRIDGANWRFPKQTGSEADREAGRDALKGDVRAAFADKSKLPEEKSYTIRNDANHARFVEDGIEGPTGPKGNETPLNGYRIFGRLKSRYG